MYNRRLGRPDSQKCRWYVEFLDFSFLASPKPVSIDTCLAVFFVRTTMPQTGMFLETWSNLWGRTKNPFNTNFSAGGSSGGDGALVAMRGAPFCPSTDIGGSIRAPGTFNGLYAIRPTAERTAKRGMGTAAPGQVSIKVSCGPNCHSMSDLKLVTEILLTHHGLRFESTAVPMPWKQIETNQGKLSFGLMTTDDCVTPHPPIARALQETAAKLRSAGHEGLVPTNLPSSQLSFFGLSDF